jgi:hypothetical protein
MDLSTTGSTAVGTGSVQEKASIMRDSVYKFFIVEVIVEIKKPNISHFYCVQRPKNQFKKKDHPDLE